MKIGILTTLNNPMLGLSVKSISKVFKINCIIADSKDWSTKNKLIWEERTKGKIKEVSPYTINQATPFFLVKNHNSFKTIELVEQRRMDLLINCGTPRILNPDMLKSTKIGVLNCHPGLLPDYRGCSCVEWALYNEDPGGNTAHLMTEKIDEGPIILKKLLDMSRYTKYEDIRIANYLDSIDVIVKAIIKLNKGGIDFINYPKDGKYYKPIDRHKMNLILKKFV